MFEPKEGNGVRKKGTELKGVCISSVANTVQASGITITLVPATQNTPPSRKIMVKWDNGDIEECDINDLEEV